jgi:dTDP-4-dehydrorhamnose 3,5-epimerase-like enzyme
MSITPLPIEGSYLFQSPTHEDERGYSGEWFKSSAINKILEIITEENKASDCSKEEAIQTKKRL